MKHIISAICLLSVAVFIVGCPGTKDQTSEVPPAERPPQGPPPGQQPPPGMHQPGAPQDPKGNLIFNLNGGLSDLEARLEKYRAEVGSDHPDIVEADSIVADAKAAIKALEPLTGDEELLMAGHKVNTRLFHLDQLLSRAGK